MTGSRCGDFRRYVYVDQSPRRRRNATCYYIPCPDSDSWPWNVIKNAVKTCRLSDDECYRRISQPSNGDSSRLLAAFIGCSKPVATNPMSIVNCSIADFDTPGSPLNKSLSQRYSLLRWNSDVLSNNPKAIGRFYLHVGQPEFAAGFGAGETPAKKQGVKVFPLC